ncbi:MAG: TolB family protein [Planctomycetota bacterium]|jgi:Tol biopolymer transport system component
MSNRLILRLGALLAVLALLSATSVAGKGGGKGKPGGGGGEPPPNPEIVYLDGGDLRVMNADGTNRTVVLEGSNSVSIDTPDWSPDGSRLVFEGNIDGQHGIYVINLDGTGLREVAGLAAVAGTGGPVWAPGPVSGGGTVIAYLDVAPGESRSDIFLVDPDAATPTPERLTTSAEWSEGAMSWSPSATKLAVKIGGTGSQDAYALYDFTEGTYTLQQHAGPLAGADVSQPAWSKTDETVIAWTVRIPGDAWPDIWTVDLDNPAGALNLTASDDAGERRPTWSPDDSEIAYMSSRPGRGKKIVMGIESITASGTLVTSLSTGGFASWRR